MLYGPICEARTFSASPGGIESEIEMKSVAEVGDEGEDEADLSMRRPSETINYAKYLLRYVYVCVCVLRVH